jgi:maleamate amidohydrolase
MTSNNLQQNSLGLTSRPALLLVDMINGFTDPACALGSACPEVEAFRALGLPVFFTTVVYHSEQQAEVFRRKVPALNVLQPDSHWVKVDSALEPLESEPVIEKQWASAFFATDLDQQLSALGVDSIVVTGLTTSGCVRASAVDGLQNDYQVVIAEEAVGDRNPEAHRANLFDLNAKYADVLPVAQVLSQLTALCGDRG